MVEKNFELSEQKVNLKLKYNDPHLNKEKIPHMLDGVDNVANQTLSDIVRIFE
jgi:hypothetical protein